MAARHRPYPLAMSHEEVAFVMGVNRKTVQQIEEVALRKLRRLLDESGLDFDDLVALDRERGVFDQRDVQGEPEVSGKEWTRKARAEQC